MSSLRFGDEITESSTADATDGDFSMSGGVPLRSDPVRVRQEATEYIIKTFLDI